MDGPHLLSTTSTPEVGTVAYFILLLYGVKTQSAHNRQRLDHTLLQVLVHFQKHFLQECAWSEGNVCTLGCTPAACQTRKQSHHLVGLRGDRAVHASLWAAAVSSVRWRRRSPFRGAPCTDLCRQGSFLLQRGFLHYNIKSFLHYNILLSPFRPFTSFFPSVPRFPDRILA